MGKYGLLLSALLPDIAFEQDFSLAERTTVGIGGTVNAFFPKTVGELSSLVRLCERCNIRYFPLGAGSNVLASEREYDGIVVVTDYFNHCAVSENNLTAECGVSVAKLLNLCKSKGLSGLEFLAGIPATVGGLTFMNGGTKIGHVADAIDSVTFLHNGKIQNYSIDECRFGYKDSLFQHISCFILSVRFRLTQSTSERVSENIFDILKNRSYLPKGKSMGCIFKNPKGGISAGRLIEESGCKGWRAGYAVVSEKHANFILNEQNATSKDFRILIECIKRQVYEHTGILLQEEIRYME